MRLTAGDSLVVVGLRDETWRVRGGGLPQRHYGDEDSLLIGRWGRVAREVVTVAIPGNSAFIAALFRKAKSLGVPMRIMGPRVVSDQRLWSNGRAVAAGGASVLDDGLFIPASVGGPHVMTWFEEPIYAAAGFREMDCESQGRVLLDNHPILAAMRFFGEPPDALRSLVLRIRDPRWFIDARRPDGFGPLYAWAGLRGRAGGSGYRAGVVDAAWRKVGDGPASALFRRHNAFHRATRSLATADLATSRFYLRCLRGVWLSLLSPEMSELRSFDRLFEVAFTDGDVVDEVSLSLGSGLRDWVSELCKSDDASALVDAVATAKAVCPNE